MEGVARLRGLRFRYPLGGFLDLAASKSRNEAKTKQFATLQN